VRTQLPASIFLALTACVSAPPVGGALGEGASDAANITAVDTSAYPPTKVSVKLETDAYTALVLVVPGHSASLLFPPDSATDNKLSAGTHDLTFKVPGPLALSDSARLLRAREARARADSFAMGQRSSSRAPGPSFISIPPNTITYLLVVTSPQPLVYKRILDKTAGWSIPLEDMEALNAVAKQVKSTITGSSRDWAAAYHVVQLQPPPKSKK
jgi:hypothetical protein